MFERCLHSPLIAISIMMVILNLTYDTGDGDNMCHEPMNEAWYDDGGQVLSRQSRANDARFRRARPVALARKQSSDSFVVRRPH